MHYFVIDKKTADESIDSIKIKADMKQYLQAFYIYNVIEYGISVLHNNKLITAKSAILAYDCKDTKRGIACYECLSSMLEIKQILNEDGIYEHYRQSINR